MKNILTLLLLSTMITVQAQSGSIKGKVTNQQLQAIPYATIVLKTTSIGTTTNENGSYTLTNISPGSYSVQFSAIGYKTIYRELNLRSSEEISISVQLSEDLQNLNEVVITSNRRIETLDEVPSSVSVISSRELENLSQTSNSIADILAEVPGLTLSTNQTSSVGQTLRGRNMLILIDGIPQSTPLRSGGRDINTVDPNTLERIEVIKGATAIYGNGSDGGIVNYITKKPKATGKLESTTQINTEGSLVDIDHTVGTKISQTFSGKTNKIGYVASGSFGQSGIYRDANGLVMSPTYGLGETNQYNLFGKINYDLSPNQDIELMYNYYSSNQNTEYTNQPGIYGKEPAIGVIGEVLGVDEGNRHNHNAQLIYNAYKLPGNTAFKLNLYLQDFKTVYGFTDAFYNPVLGFEGGQSFLESNKKGARFNFETPYSSGKNLTGDILYGVDIMNDKTAQSIIDGRSWVPEMDMTNFAPYLQLKTEYRNFVLKTGLRIENINIDVNDFQTIVRYPVGSNTPSGGVSVEGGNLKYSATTFNAGIRYNNWNYFKPFVSFSQSFSIADLGRTLRSATANTLSQIATEAVIANNYEAGFNSRFGETNLSGAYYISTSDLGATYVEVNGIFQIARQPEKVYGFELALDTKLLKNLYMGSSVSYTEGKLDSENNGNYNTYMNGDRIPPVKTVTYLEYKIDGLWNARLSHTYSGNRKKFDANSNGGYAYGKGPVDSFNVVNFNINYQFTKNNKIGLGIQNLLNEDYYNLNSQWGARKENYFKGNGARFNLSLTFNL